LQEDQQAELDAHVRLAEEERSAREAEREELQGQAEAAEQSWSEHQVHARTVLP
jgi:hypothetical protein